MNKKLFWTGISLQVIHVIAIIVMFFPDIDLQEIRISKGAIVGITYLLFNIFSLLMIFIGALGKD